MCRKSNGATLPATVEVTDLCVGEENAPDEIVAELRAALPEPEPGAAAKKLVELMRRLPKHQGRKTNVSTHVKEHLYGSGAKSR